MSIYRIFPNKDTTLYSEVPYSNTGRDEIFELAAYEDSTGLHSISRGIVSFSNEELVNTITNIIQQDNFQARIKYYLAEASELPTDYTIQVFPVSLNWDEGKGKFGDLPEDLSGASWIYSRANSTNTWPTSNFVTGVTGSFTVDQPGGGSWIFQISGSETLSEQVFGYKDSTDINVNVTDVLKLYLTGSLPLNGFLFKIEDDLERIQQLSTRLRFFSSDTNTIYPPYLQLEWDDSVYSTGSLPIVSTPDISIKLSENKGTYYQSEKLKIRLNARPTYPTRTFTTSSIYNQNYCLPEETVWGMVDEYTGEMIIDFDQNFTKVSCDSQSPYFVFYMNTLQPERYYRFLIKTVIDGSDIIVDSKNIIKILKNV